MYSYQLRGTNGSGKTRVARYLLEESKAKPILHLGRKVRAYKGELDGYPLFILGSYETACGGCDTIPSVQEVADLLRLFMTNSNELTCFDVSEEPGIVFFEGLMISHMLGTVGACQGKLGKDKNILAFLDTPLDKCIEHVMTRRMLRKDERAFDPKNVIKDHPRVHQSRLNAQKGGFKTVTVPWEVSTVWVRQSMMNLHRELGPEV
jgi:hypothetical protein